MEFVLVIRAVAEKKIMTEAIYVHDKIITEAMSMVRTPSKEIYGVYDDYKQQKTEKMTKASASVCLLFAAAVMIHTLDNVLGRKSAKKI